MEGTLSTFVTAGMKTAKDKWGRTWGGRWSNGTLQVHSVCYFN